MEDGIFGRLTRHEVATFGGRSWLEHVHIDIAVSKSADYVASNAISAIRHSRSDGCSHILLSTCDYVGTREPHLLICVGGWFLFL